MFRKLSKTKLKKLKRECMSNRTHKPHLVNISSTIERAISKENDVNVINLKSLSYIGVIHSLLMYIKHVSITIPNVAIVPIIT